MWILAIDDFFIGNLSSVKIFLIGFKFGKKCRTSSNLKKYGILTRPCQGFFAASAQNR